MLHFTDTQYDVNGENDVTPHEAKEEEEEAAADEEQKNTDEERYRRSWRRNNEPVRSLVGCVWNENGPMMTMTTTDDRQASSTSIEWCRE